jgi:zeaxanthin glucosyltransferase
MSHLGIFCLPGSGHLYPSIALGRRLRLRGHNVTVFHLPIANTLVTRAGLTFVSVGNGICSSRDSAKVSIRPARFSVGPTISAMRKYMEIVLLEAASAVRSADIDGIVVDELDFAAGTVADLLDIPYVNVAISPPLELDPSIPPFYCGLPYRLGGLARVRNIIANSITAAVFEPLLRLLNKHRRAWGLPVFSHFNAIFSDRGTISQLPKEFEFPRVNSTRTICYTGPFLDPAGRPLIRFPFHKIQPRPLAYASLGTIQNNNPRIFEIISRACSYNNLQLVISLGGGRLDPDDLPALPGDPIVVHYAPQIDILKMASLTITHAGINTVLESLNEAVPLIAIPISDDQPGVAARIRATGTGCVIPHWRLTVPRLSGAIADVLHNSTYKQAALRMQRTIHGSDGLSLAASLVERLLELN